MKESIKLAMTMVADAGMTCISELAGKCARASYVANLWIIRKRPYYIHYGQVVPSDIKANPIIIEQDDGSRVYGIEVFTTYDDLTVIKVMANDGKVTCLKRGVKIGERKVEPFIVSSEPIYNVTLYTSRGIHTQPIYKDGYAWLVSLVPTFIMVA